MSWQRSFQIFSHKDGPTCFRGWSHQPFAPDSQKFGADMSPTNWIANPMFGIFLGGDSRNVSYAPLLLFISVYPDLCYSTPQRFTLRLQTANPWFYTVLSQSMSKFLCVSCLYPKLRFDYCWYTQYEHISLYEISKVGRFYRLSVVSKVEFTI